MTDLNQPLAKEVKILRSQISPGDFFLRTSTDGEEKYSVLHEVELDGQHYAVMHKQKDDPNDVYLFRINEGLAEEVDEDDEWERVAEAVDEMLYFYDS
ncbi:DUF1292 domain-containing protein [Hazenella coriacea]|uniref:Uncharacterized protein DUF1292 n=1 Tax=Hazenella coriacea TaxID=1179467 RepID=A0A4R3L524_9BACL|nr:DUF1292 domain-containing protein [Hazenella coriacea]TCS94891.1 uncharacterized protein DUF1292 [Hazenella coriacea]